MGQANIDMAYGSSMAFNCPYDIVMEHIKKKSEESPEFKSYVDESNKTAWGNTRLIWNIFKEVTKDLLAGKLNWDNSVLLAIVSPLIAAGSLPMMLFARNQRDTLLAKACGLIRNIGGIGGDIVFAATGRIYKKLVAAFCGISGIAGIWKRWTTESIAQLLIHLQAAMDVGGYAAWNAFSGKELELEKRLAMAKA